MKSNQIKHFNFIVIGSGPAGENAAIQASQFNQSVLLIEKNDCIGGASLHTGSVPSKALREAALNLEHTLHLNKLIFSDFTIEKKSILQHVNNRKNTVIQKVENRSLAHLLKHNIEILHGKAEFKSPHIIKVERGTNTIEVHGDFIIIATGSQPRRLSWDTVESKNILDSDSILKIDTLFKKMTIIGSGVIGCEYACILAKLGIHIDLISTESCILPFLDKQIRDILTRKMQENGIVIHLNESIEHVKDNHEQTHVHLKSGKQITSNAIMLAVGREANTKHMNLDKVGIELNQKKQIQVNHFYQSSLSHIYAVGDVIGHPGLTSTSIIQGRIAVLHALKKLQRHHKMQWIPYGIWTIPAIATVGKTEEELIQKQTAYKIGVAHFKDLTRVSILDNEAYDGILKLIFNPDNLKLYGVHIIGPNAPEMIHLGQAVLDHQGTINYFAQSVFNYPTLDEAYSIAALNGLKHL